VRQAVVTRLRDIAIAGEPVPRSVVLAAAQFSGAHERTVWRWLNEETGGRRPRFELTDEHLVIISASPKGLRAAWREMRRRGMDVPSYPHFTKAWNGLGRFVREGVRGGPHAAAAGAVYWKVADGLPNDIRVIDVFEHPVWVLDKRGRPFKPLDCSILDHSTRMPVAVNLTADPVNGAIVKATMGDGVRGYCAADGTYIGGCSARYRIDNGGENLAEEVAIGAMLLHGVLDPTTPYQSWENGRRERWGRTVQEDFCATQPGYAKGPTEPGGAAFFVPPASQMISFELYRARYRRWLDEYIVRPHAGLDDMSPLEAWKARVGEIRPASPDDLRDCMYEIGTRLVHGWGIHHDGEDYFSRALLHYGGQSLTVKKPLTNAEAPFLEVFVGRDHLTTAMPHRFLPEDEREKMLEERAEGFREIRSINRRAAQDRVIAAAARDGEPEGSVPVGAYDPVASVVAAGDREAKRRTRKAPKSAMKESKGAPSSATSEGSAPAGGAASTDADLDLFNRLRGGGA
jgi:hypothetical protein